jgi:hypothetical protein
LILDAARKGSSAGGRALRKLNDLPGSRSALVPFDRDVRNLTLVAPHRGEDRAVATIDVFTKL